MAQLLSGTRIYGTGTVDSQLFINGNTAATSTNTGALQVVGGVGVGGNLFVGGTLYASAVTGNITTATNLAGGNASQLAFQTALGVTSFVSSGTAGQILVSAGSTSTGPVFTNTSTIRVGFATNAINASTLLSGTAQSIVYQSSTGTTAFLSASTSGYLLSTQGTGAAPAWISQASLTAGGVDTVKTIENATNSIFYPTFVNSNNVSATGESLYTTSSFSINPYTGYVTIGTSSTISGSVSAPLTVYKDGSQESNTPVGTYNVAQFGNSAGSRGVGINYDPTNVTGGLYSFGINSNLIFYTPTGSTYKERMRISTGTVGIGTVGLVTTAPLHVAAPLSTGTIVTVGMFTQNIDTALTTGSGVRLVLAAGNSQSRAAIIEAAVESGLNAHYLAFSTNASGASPTEKMRITSAGGIAFGGATNYGATGNVLVSQGDAAPQWTAIGAIAAGQATTATNLAGGSAAQIAFQTAIGKTSFAGPGTAGQILVSAGSTSTGPVFTNTSTIRVGFATNATTLENGTAQSIVYQSSTGTTAFLSASTSGYLLSTQGTGAAPTWISQASITAGGVDTIKTVGQASIADYYPTFVNSNNVSATGESLYTTSSFIINPATKEISVNGTGRFTSPANGTTGAVVLRANTTNTATTYLQWSNNASTIQYGAIGVTSATDIVFLNSSVERMRITSTGAIAFSGATNYGSSGNVLVSQGDAAPQWTAIGAIAAGQATTATNLAGGTAGQLPYQNAPGDTSFAGPGTAGQILVSAGSTSTGPVFTNTSTIRVGFATNATTLSSGTAQSIVYQSSVGTTAFLAAGTSGQVLQTNGTGSAPTWVSTGSLTAGQATTATNLAGGTAGQLAFQNAPGDTGFAGPGTAGQILVSAGSTSTGPVFTNTSTIRVGFADNASTLLSGTVQSIVYQSSTGTTAFLSASTSGYLLSTQGTGAAPAWISQASLTAGGVDTVKTVGQVTSSTFYPVFVNSNNSSATGEYLYTTSSFSINPYSGHVGISKTNPSAPLEIGDENQFSGDPWIRIRSTASNIRSAFIQLTGRQLGVDETWSMIAAGSGLGNAGLRFTRGDWVTGTVAMVIDSSGNVGIGTGPTQTIASTYGSDLVVHRGATRGGGGADTRIAISNTSTTGASNLRFYTSATSYLTAEIAVGGPGYTSWAGALSLNFLAVQGGPIAFHKGGNTPGSSGSATELMRITPNGAIAFSGATNYGSSGNVLVSQGDAAPQWTAIGAIAAGQATTATNLAGGTANAIPYQSSAGTTAFLAATTSGYVLATQGTGSAPTWVSQASITSSVGDSLKTVSTATSAKFYPTFVNSNNASPTAEQLYTTSSISVNPGTGDVSAPQFIANNAMILNTSTVMNSYTIPTGYNAMSVGPISVSNGVTVTISSGQRWVIL